MSAFVKKLTGPGTGGDGIASAVDACICLIPGSFDKHSQTAAGPSSAAGATGRLWDGMIDDFSLL